MTHSRPVLDCVMVMSVGMYDDSFTACARLCGWL